MSAAAWLDVMPAIPLSEAVPVSRGPEVEAIVIWVEEYISGKTGRCVLLRYEGGGEFYADWAECRVNLDHPQGFAYALRWYTGARSEVPLNGARLAVDMPRRADSMLDRWLLGTTTDADRIALARACAEVSR